MIVFSFALASGFFWLWLWVVGLWLRNVNWLRLRVVGLWLRDMIGWNMWMMEIDHWSGLLSVHVSCEGIIGDSIKSSEWIIMIMVRRSWWVVARWSVNRWRVNRWVVARWLVSGWVIWFRFRWVIRLGLRVVRFRFWVHWLWFWVVNLLKFERVKDGLNVNSCEVLTSEGIINEVVILLQLVLFHHEFALRFLFPLWLDVSVLNSPWFWFLVGLWLIMVNGWMIGFWFVVVNWLWLMIRVNRMMVWFWFIVMHWLWLMIGVNRRMVRLWFVITILLPMSSVNWITLLLNLWVIETSFILVDAWNWVWVPELWVSKMITFWFLISVRWSVMMDIRKRGVVWLMFWVCLWLEVWVTVGRLWSMVGLWSVVDWLWSFVDWLRCMVCMLRLWLVGDLKSVRIVIITI